MVKKHVEIPKKHAGIPRSHAVAKKLGYKRVPATAFAKLSAKSKRNFIKFADHGARAGSVCGIAPGDDDAHWLVCYKNEVGQCTWIQVPKGEPISDHG
jgi:hypothetical protein